MIFITLQQSLVTALLSPTRLCNFGGPAVNLMSISIDLSKILEKCCFSETGLTKRKIRDGADWASFLSVPCCGNVSFSQEREKKNSEKLYMEFLCLVLELVLFRLMV